MTSKAAPQGLLHLCLKTTLGVLSCPHLWGSEKFTDMDRAVCPCVASAQEVAQDPGGGLLDTSNKLRTGITLHRVPCPPQSPTHRDTSGPGQEVAAGGQTRVL